MTSENILLLCAIGCVIFIVYAKWKTRKQESTWAPSNRLEELLLKAQGTEVNRELLRELLHTQLYAMQCEDAPQKPMTLGARFPAEFAKGDDAAKIGPDGLVEIGPRLLCFSSQAVVNGLRETTPLGMIADKCVPFSARILIEYALEKRVDLVLNPFFGVCVKFDETALHIILNEE